MIQQTESRYGTIRGYGCLMFVYIMMVGKKFNHDFTIPEIESLWLKAIDREIILDNDKPTDGSRGEWYRCWIDNPVAFMKLVAASIGKLVTPILLFKGHDKRVAPYYVIENVSSIKTQSGIKHGIHFTGEFGLDDYNPDVRIDLASIKSIRGWSI